MRNEQGQYNFLRLRHNENQVVFAPNLQAELLCRKGLHTPTRFLSLEFRATQPLTNMLNYVTDTKCHSLEAGPKHPGLSIFRLSI